MTSKTYRYKFSRRTIRATLITVAVFIAIGVGLYLLYRGGYFSAWFTSFVGALIALMSLSVPRRIVVDNNGLHIYCLLDVTELSAKEIASARTVKPSEMHGIIPVFGSCGFFGYYGYYLDLKQWELVRLYTTEWNNFVEITDIYERRIYVSCSEPDALVNNLQRTTIEHTPHPTQASLPLQ